MPPGSYDIPAEVTFMPLHQPVKTAVLDLAIMDGRKSELTSLAWYTRLKTVTHPSTNRAQR